MDITTLNVTLLQPAFPWCACKALVPPRRDLASLAIVTFAANHVMSNQWQYWLGCSSRGNTCASMTTATKPTLLSPCIAICTARFFLSHGGLHYRGLYHHIYSPAAVALLPHINTVCRKKKDAILNRSAPAVKGKAINLCTSM